VSELINQTVETIKVRENEPCSGIEQDLTLRMFEFARFADDKAGFAGK
jgi:hypothetical protein